MAVRDCRHILEECPHQKHGVRFFSTDGGDLGFGSGPTYQCTTHQAFVNENGKVMCTWPTAVVKPCTWDCGHQHEWQKITAFGFYLREECKICFVWKAHVEQNERVLKMLADDAHLRDQLRYAFTGRWKEIVDELWGRKLHEEQQRAEEEEDRGCPCCR